MTYIPKKFVNINDDNSIKSGPFNSSSQLAINLLESITPVDKAQAVPYVSIWEINPATGKAMHPNKDGRPVRPLSTTLWETPAFGSSISGVTFRERPPVSLERISIKTNNPRGIILYRTLDMTFVVHRSDVIFERHVNSDGTHNGDADSWSSLITPGQAFALEYGWSTSDGIKNGILNGEGFADVKAGVVIKGREQIRFVVTSYDFSFSSDMQIKINVKAYELGESGLRQAQLVDVTNVDNSTFPLEPYNMGAEPLKKLVNTIRSRIFTDNNLEKSRIKKMVSVPFGLLIDIIFVDIIKNAFTNMGLEFKSMFVGSFNLRAGKPLFKYSAGADISNKPIADFSIPLEDVNNIFSDLIDSGKTLTVYNFLEPFLRIFSDPRTWDRKDDTAERSIPQIITRSVTRKKKDGKMEVYFYIFDVNREYSRFTERDSDKLPKSNVTRDDIRKLVNDKGIPFVSTINAASYIKDATFEVIQDEQMKSVFINRYFHDSSVGRFQKIMQPDILAKEDHSPAAQQIFSPVIQGSITMLGNFVLDTFSLIWLDFGIKLWDGPFTLYEREDVIESGEFVTTVKVYSNSVDPFGMRKH